MMDFALLWRRGRDWFRHRIRLHSRVAFRLFTAAIFVALGYSLYKNWYVVRDYLWGIRYEYLCLALATHAIALGCTAVAWHFIMRALAADAHFRTDSKIYYYTTVAKRIPGVIWYVAGRAHLYSEEGISKPVVLTAVVMETALVFVSGVAFLLLLSPLYSYWPLTGSAGVLLLPAIPLIAIVLRPSILVSFVNVLLRRFRQAQISIDLSPSWMSPICTMYVLGWLVGGVSLYFVIRASYALPVSELPTVIGFATISGLTGLLTLALPAGMGIKEVTLAALLSHYVSFPVAVMIALLFRMLTTVDEILWALISTRL